MPEPKEPLEKGVFETYENMEINLNALYEGKDPFKGEEINPNDIPDNL